MLPRKKDFSSNNLRLKRVFEMQRAGITTLQTEPDAWRVPSLSHPDQTHTVRVRLARAVTHVDAIGAALDATCSCPARVECKHILAVRLEYNREASLLFRLAGLDESAGFTELLRLIDRRKAVAA